MTLKAASVMDYVTALLGALCAVVLFVAGNWIAAMWAAFCSFQLVRVVWERESK